MTAVALASTVTAPQYDWTPAEKIELIESKGELLADRTGVVVNDPKRILGEVSVKYGVDYDTLYRVIMCESGFRHEGLFGDSGKAYGISQFHKPTWDLFNQIRGTDLDYYSLEDQLDLMAWAFAHGYQSHWSCY